MLIPTGGVVGGGSLDPNPLADANRVVIIGKPSNRADLVQASGTGQSRTSTLFGGGGWGSLDTNYASKTVKYGYLVGFNESGSHRATGPIEVGFVDAVPSPAGPNNTLVLSDANVTYIDPDGNWFYKMKITI